MSGPSFIHPPFAKISRFVLSGVCHPPGMNLPTLLSSILISTLQRQTDRQTDTRGTNPFPPSKGDISHTSESLSSSSFSFSLSFQSGGAQLINHICIICHCCSRERGRAGGWGKSSKRGERRREVTAHTWDEEQGKGGKGHHFEQNQILRGFF